MASDYAADEYIETYEDSPTLDRCEEGVGFDLEGDFYGGAETRIDCPVDTQSNQSNNDSGATTKCDDGNSRSTSTDVAYDASGEANVDCPTQDVELGSSRNIGRGKGGGNRAGRGRGSSKESTPKSGNTPTRKRGSTKEDGRPAKSRKKSEDTGVVGGRGAGQRNKGLSANEQSETSDYGCHEQRNTKSLLGGKSDHESIGRRDLFVTPPTQLLSTETIKNRTMESVQDRKQRYLASILCLERETREKKESAGAEPRCRIDIIALGEKIRETKGIKCFSLDAFIICNKDQLVCYGTFIDGEGKISVGTRDLIANYNALCDDDPNLDIALSEDTKKRMNRKWWKVPSHCYRKILAAQNESLLQVNGERMFLMTLTGVQKGTMVDKNTGEQKTTFTPELVFTPIKTPY